MAARLTGLIAAAYTPMRRDFSIDTEAIGPLTDRLVAEGVAGLFVCGSTGEGVSLSTDERRRVAEAYLSAAGRRVPVVVHAGHHALAEACELARHAQASGADYVAALAPHYFPIPSVSALVDAVAPIAAAAPKIPFLYYHIPAMTRIELDMAEFLKLAGNRIENLAGLKYTANTLHTFQECADLENGRFDALFGYDEMLLPALSVGARGAVGSTYNIAAPLYRRIIAAFDAGDVAGARAGQLQAVRLIRTLGRFAFHPAVKAVLGMIGAPAGPCRLPLPQLGDADRETLRVELEKIGFFDWGRRPFAGATK